MGIMISTDDDGQPTSTTERPHHVWEKFLLENSPVYRELAELRRKGWQNPKGDSHFYRQRKQADAPSEKTKQYFFTMMVEIGAKMDAYSSILTFDSPSPSPSSSPSSSPSTSSSQPTSPTSQPTSTPPYPRVLDLCFAPGGFASTILSRNPRATIHGTTLPPAQGGHAILLPRWRQDRRLRIRHCDVTMRAGEMGVPPSAIPDTHPDRSDFDFSAPGSPLFPSPDNVREEGDEGEAETEVEGQYDLLILDGQVLRTHTEAQTPHRVAREPKRLCVSQLVLGLRRLAPGGRIVLLLHRADAIHTALLLRTLSKLSQRIQLFKPVHKHGIRSSFYVLATGVRSDSAEAARAVREWQEDWAVATLGTPEEWADRRTEAESMDVVRGLIEEGFAREVVRLAEPVWAIQAASLMEASFMR
ncbi:hypothetical protein F5B20DRAFT_268468 [Whalleya microplaca]|nr:hypothetical protein F5B20DRAFT_268468 [Whalleya microplaca]